MSGSHRPDSQIIPFSPAQECLKSSLPVYLHHLIQRLVGGEMSVNVCKDREEKSQEPYLMADSRESTQISSLTR